MIGDGQYLSSHFYLNFDAIAQVEQVISGMLAVVSSIIKETRLFQERCVCEEVLGF